MAQEKGEQLLTFAAAAALGNRYRRFHLRRVERDESFVILSHGSPSA
jgi:hypothetical protein